MNGKQLKNIRIGDEVYRTKNHQLCQTLVLENARKGLKENIHFSVMLKKDLFAKIKADCGDYSVTVTGTKVAEATKQPLSRDSILEKLYKLGDAPFQIASVDLDMDEDCFYSMKEFNMLRRQAVAELMELCNASGRRVWKETIQ